MRQFAVAAIVALLAGPVQVGPVHAQSQPPREATLTVHGQSRMEVAPDRATLTVDVVTHGKTSEAAMTSHRERVEQAMQKLHAMESRAIKIERSTFRLNETRPPVTPGAPPTRGTVDYQAVTTFELLSTRIDALDAAVTAIASTGLFEVRNIRFAIGDRNPAMSEARKAAIGDARERARTYADAAGVGLKGILTIVDGNASRSPEVFVAAPAARSVGIVPPDTLSVTATVTVTWRIAEKP